MPVYEYICDECQKQFDKRVSFAQADEAQPCPECGDRHTHKLLSSFAVGGQTGRNGSATAAMSSSPFT